MIYGTERTCRYTSWVSSHNEPSEVDPREITHDKAFTYRPEYSVGSEALLARMAERACFLRLQYVGFGTNAFTQPSENKRPLFEKCKQERRSTRVSARRNCASILGQP